MKRNSGWIWYFLVVFGLALAGTAWLVIFNLGLQLTSEELARNRERWSRTKPADYDLTYTIKKNDEARGKQYQVRARGGEVVCVSEEGLELPAEQAGHFTMEAFFDLMQKKLDEDARPGQPKVYARARFHEENGAVLEYVRRVMRTQNRLEISVQKFRFGGDLTPESSGSP